ncbi:MAG TPA: PadR family transcriptional regulator [Acidimicrobiia bacterium]|nr:PadR family transcriptional regulator [Acidimicrobiia bacterium]
MPIDDDLTAAEATPLVLAVLSEGEGHGYAILKRVRELSGGELAWADGMLYPLLHRLRRLGYVTADWRAEDGRRRRFYAITPTGRGAGSVRRRSGTETEPSGGVGSGALASSRSHPVRRRRRNRRLSCPRPALVGS